MALTAWLGDARAVLTTFFGRRWNTQWAQAGYINPTTATPTTIKDRLKLGGRLAMFFTANPSYEAATLNVTGAVGTARTNAVVATQQAVGIAAKVLDQSKTARGAAAGVLTTQMRMLVRILEGLLAANDPRWKDFGLNMPSANTTPGQPQDVTVASNPPPVQALAAGMSGNVLAQCSAVPLTTRYRWRMRIPGVQENYTLMASTKEPVAMIQVTPGVTVEIVVQAANGQRQGVASDPVVYVAPLAEPAAEPEAAPVLAVTAVRSNGSANGNGSNGHARHARS